MSPQTFRLRIVDRRASQHATDARDAAVALVDCETGAHRLRADDHRAELQDVEVDAVLAHAGLAVQDRPAVLELDRERREPEQRAHECEAGSGDGDVRGAVHRVPFAFSQVWGVPERR
jgi:hypothetical protein